MNPSLFNSIESENKNISSLLKYHAVHTPYQRALVYPEIQDKDGRTAYSQLTFRQLDQESDCLAAGLKRIGVNQEMSVLIATSPGLFHFSLIYAILKIGAVAIQVDPDLGIRTLSNCIKSVKPDVFIGPSHVRFLKYVYPLRLKSIKTYISVDRYFLYKSLHISHIRKNPWTRQEPEKRNNADIALMTYTTDPDGNPRCNPFSHGHLMSAAQNTISCFDFQDKDTLISMIPPFSILGPCLGMTTIIPQTQKNEKNSSDFSNEIQLIVDMGITHLFTDPAQIHKMAIFIKENRGRIPSLKRAVSIGAPLNPEEIIATASFLDKKTEVTSLYSTDSMLPITHINSRYIKDKTRELSQQGYGNCIGRTFKNAAVNLIKITDEQITQWSNDLVTPKGEPGEIVYKQNIRQNDISALPEYDHFNTIKENNNIWIRTGDIGWMDNQGYIWYCGKKSHRIITQNSTLFTVPCELIFNTHESVAQTIVVGVGPEDNKKPVICVVLNDENILDRETIRDELFSLANRHVITKQVDTILFPELINVGNGFSPESVRDKLSVWAERLIHLNPEAGHKNKSLYPTA